MTIGDRIRLVRRQLGYTQAQLARKLKMSQTQLAKYENSRGNPSVQVLYRLASALETSSDYLISGRDKSIAKKIALEDEELLDLVRRIAQLRAAQRDKIKWAIEGLLSNISNNGEAGIKPEPNAPSKKLAKSA